MRPLRYYPPGVSTYHVTSKCVDDQFLWLPTQQTTFIIASALAATLRKYDVGLYAVAVMSNHFHLVVRAEQLELSAAMQFFKSRLARTLNPILGRRGVMSRERFRHQPVLDEASFAQLVHYVHANPVRAHCVERAEQWPGLSSYLALAQGRGSIDVAYFDEPAWRAAARRGKRADFTSVVRVPIEPPPWRGISAAARGAIIRAEMEATERATAQLRRQSRTRVPRLTRLMRMDPRTRPKQEHMHPGSNGFLSRRGAERCPSASPRSGIAVSAIQLHDAVPTKPEPWAFGLAEAVQTLREAYRAMRSVYQQVSARFRLTGVLDAFPPGTFPPWVGAHLASK